MVKRNKRFTVSVSMILMFMLLIVMFVTPNIVLAIEEPDTFTIKQVDVYTGVKEDNDQLYIITYDIAYSGTAPSGYDSEDMFLIRLMNAIDSQLGASVPQSYYNDGLIDGISGIYFSASDVSNAGMTFDPANGYYMQLVGNPMIVWDSGTPPYENKITFGNYYNSDITDTLYTRLSVEITILQNIWGIDLIEGPSGERTLTVAGQEYVSEAIPNARILCPQLFPAAISRVEMEDTELISDFYVGGDTAQRGAIGNTWLAQTFTASLQYELDRICIEGNIESGTQPVSVQLYNTSSSQPHALCASGTIPASDFLIDPANDWETTAISPYELTLGTEYAIVVHCTSGTVNWRYDPTSTYDGSAWVSTNAGSTWTQINNATFQFQTKAKNAPSLSYSTRLEHQLDGTVFDTSDSELYLGLSSIWVRTLIWLVVSCVVAVIVAYESNNSKPITPIIFWMIGAGYFIGMVDPALAIGFAVLGGLATIYITVFNRSSA